MNEEFTVLGGDYDSILGAVTRQAQAAGKPVPMVVKGGIATGKQATARDEAMRRINQIDDKLIVKGLAEGRLALVDSRYYFVQDIAAATQVKMIKNDDKKSTGLTNVAQARLDTGTWFMLTGMSLRTGLYPTSIAHIKETVFDLKALTTIACESSVANGDFEFRINGGKHVLPKDTSCSIFCSGRTDQPLGYYQLDSPKWIKPDAEMFFDINLAFAGTALTACRLELFGMSVVVF